MSETLIEFDVVGDPVPQGSTRAFAIRKGKGEGAPIVGVGTTNDPSGSIAKWRADIRAAFDGALEERPTPMPLAGAVGFVIEFRKARPKSHYLPANRSRPVPVLRLDAPTWPVGPPDLDKLERAVLDALKLKAYDDDAQVCRMRSHKIYAERGGATIRVLPLSPDAVT